MASPPLTVVSPWSPWTASAPAAFSPQVFSVPLPHPGTERDAQATALQELAAWRGEERVIC